VFLPKYRRKILFGKVKRDVREILKKLCEYKKIEIVEGTVREDHVHLYLSIPPKYSIATVTGYLKGKSALMIFDAHPDKMNKWNKNFWARGYYAATVGNTTEDAIKKYIREQEEADRREDLRRS
jgi:putative transposase